MVTQASTTTDENILLENMKRAKDLKKEIQIRMSRWKAVKNNDN
jgi:hypothetical protein